MSTPEDTAKRNQQEEVCFALVAGEAAGGKGEMLMRVPQQQQASSVVVCVWMCDIMDSHQSTEEDSVCIIILTLRRDKLWL